jgi:hypothetical protein
MPALVKSMARLLITFNDGEPASTQKGARPSKQPRKHDTGPAETPTKMTVATIATSTTGWKAEWGIARI